MSASTTARPNLTQTPVQELGVASTPGPLDAEVGHQSMIDRMKAYFKTQPRETIRIPKDKGDQFAQINGYGFQIMAGERVSVPVDVAELLRNADII